MLSYEVKMPLILWTVRIACLLYVLAISAWLARRYTWFRPLWTLACLSYLAHVVAAFSLHHHWSHDAAYQETARQTGDLFGMYWGGGLYFNYAFTALWTADMIWSWKNFHTYVTRPKRIAATTHSFLAFMFFNGAIVFAHDATRWLGVVAAAVLVIQWIRTTTSNRTESV